MSYKIELYESKQEPFTTFSYRILHNDNLIAYYWHDYKGDDHGIEFLNGKIESSPLGRMTDFLAGGGPQPLCLSKQAIAYLNQMTQNSSHK